jgi:cytidine deaminase
MDLIERMLAAARQAQDRAYAPYSRFRVGAAVACANGTIFSGCNVENAALPNGTCAETAAIAQMIAAGEHRIEAILLVGDGDRLVTPCGGCRQRICEFADEATLIHSAGPDGLRQSFTLAQLLPFAFGPSHLRGGGTRR